VSGPRHAAWRILRSGRSTPLREVDRVAAAYGLEDRDRGLLRRLIGTEVRRRATLRAIVQHFSKGKPSPDVTAHLRLGVAQLCFLDKVPPHAAVSESVRACSDTVSLARARYVNGVLRSVQRALRPGHLANPRRDLVGADWHLTEDVFRDPQAHPLLWLEDAYSMPAALLKRWQKNHGEERARALAALALDEPPLSIVCLRGDREALAAELDLETRPGAHSCVLLAPPGATGGLIASPAFQEGRVTVQGETALRAAELLEAREGEHVLEVCAAPGGKTAVLARGGARVLALDRNRTRLAPLASNLARLGVGDRVSSAACDGAGALRDGVTFDAALVDAPCSNTGVLAARPGARWRFGPASIRDLGQVQARLLDETAARVREGGRLVYSVCSLEPEEGPRRARAFLEDHPGWRLEKELVSLPAAEGPVDGGYAARMAR
jgi:16S rRNA (cytosine967-C5)-methyltransferase